MFLDRNLYCSGWLNLHIINGESHAENFDHRGCDRAHACRSLGAVRWRLGRQRCWFGWWFRFRGFWRRNGRVAAEWQHGHGLGYAIGDTRCDAIHGLVFNRSDGLDGIDGHRQYR